MDIIERLRQGRLVEKHQDGTETWQSPHHTMLEAADEIKKLRHEIAIMTHGIELENEKLRGELAACQRDAERYRWLSKNHYGQVYCAVSGMWDVKAMCLENWIDAALDAAREM